MALDEDLKTIERQERDLVFNQFNMNDGWELGALLVTMAQERGLPVVVDIRLHSMPIFTLALPGATVDNHHWVRRKSNVCLRFFQSSYSMGLRLKTQDTTLQDKFGIPDADFAAHGGSFPINVLGSGCIGAITVSGLPQRDDHLLVVEALSFILKKDFQALSFAG